jgi:hypothetical protein
MQSFFGAGIITVLNVPALRANAYFWIPVVVVASLILAAPFAWLIAPRLQAPYDRGRTLDLFARQCALVSLSAKMIRRCLEGCSLDRTGKVECPMDHKRQPES